MGLDMDLYRKRYIKNWDFELEKNPEKRYELVLKRGGEVVELEDPIYITEEVATWRKANAIHNWFVENCNNGIDNNGSFGVGYESLVELQKTVNEVLGSIKMVKAKVKNGQRLTDDGWEDIMEDGETVEDPGLAAELLPTQSGFFFGSLDYDQWYVRQLRYTKKVLDEVLSHPEAEDHEYEYYSSW